MFVKTYLSLGGNLGDVKETLHHAILLINKHPEVSCVRCSRLYRTSPVGGVAQPDFLNMACCVETTMTLVAFHSWLQTIEHTLGKQASVVKNGPRKIDIDILFFGDECMNTHNLIVPHPRWKERLFVLTPLADLAQKINCWDIEGLLQNFPNNHKETVVPIDSEIWYDD